MSVESGVNRTFILLNDDDIPPAEETEEVDTDDEEPLTDVELVSGDDVEASGDEEGGDEEVVLVFDWSMDKCKADYAALCASDYKESSEGGDACTPESIDLLCDSVKILVDSGLETEGTAEAL